jgi:hypothetical protein
MILSKKPIFSSSCSVVFIEKLWLSVSRIQIGLYIGTPTYNTTKSGLCARREKEGTTD